MDSEKEKNRLSDIVLERVGLTGNLLSAPVSPSLEPVVEIPSHGSQVRAGKVTGPEEYKRRFLVPAPRAAEWKTATLMGDCTAGSPCWSGRRLRQHLRFYHPVVGTPYGGTQGGHRLPAR
mgnify:FL=1